MGNTASSDDNNDNNDNNNNHLDPFDGSDTLGYRVLGVQPDSPAAAAGLVSFLDFLIGVNGSMLLGCGEDLEEGDEYDDIDLPALLLDHKGTAMEFLVWNIKSQKERLVTLVPNDTWGGAGLLGVTIRLDNYEGAEERLIRVLDVVQQQPPSPAAVAGLLPDTDYLLGTTTQTLDSVSTLARLLRMHQDTVLDLYVYNSKTDMVRMVALVPSVTWAAAAGGGLLGAELGTGYLHRLPKAVTETVGVSVQRKVRYVGTKDSATDAGEGTSGDQNRNGDDGGNGNGGNHPNGLRSQATSTASSTSSFTTVNMSPTDPSKGTVLVEVEPQLEMEAHETETESEDEDEDEDNVPSQQQQQQQQQPPVQLQPPVQQQRQLQQRTEAAQSTAAAAARVAAAAAITESEGVHKQHYNNAGHSAAQLQELQQRLPPPPSSPPLEEVQIFQPPLLPDQLRLSRSGSSEGPYPAHAPWGRSTSERFQPAPPPLPSPQQLQMSRSGSSDGQQYPNNIQWNRSFQSTRSGASSTDGESSIGNDLPVRTATPVKMHKVEVVSPPSSIPGAFTSVNAIFSKPPPKGQSESPIQSSSPAGYVKAKVPASLLEQLAPIPLDSPLSSPTERVTAVVVPEAAEFVRGTKPKSPMFPPPPMMHYVAQPSTNK